MHDMLLANKLGALGSVIDAVMIDAISGLSSSTAAALLTLQHHGPLNTTALCGVIGLSQPATTRLLDRAVGEGLVARSNEKGTRETELRLTRKGRHTAETLQRQRLDRLSKLMARLDAHDRKHFARIVDALLAVPVTDRAYARFVCRFCDHVICAGPDCPVGCAATRVEQTKRNRR